MLLRDPGRQDPRLPKVDTKGEREEDRVLEIWSLGPNLQNQSFGPLSTPGDWEMSFSQSPKKITKWFVKVIAFSLPQLFSF